MTVMGSGKTLKEAIAQAHKKGCLNPIMMHVPEKDMYFSGAHSLILSK